MSGRIPPEFINELINRTDIVELVNERVPLKKAGRDYKACCPFHNEKSPSFTVSASKQFYHCFGCGAHGTAVSFIMDYERLEFLDAIQLLAEKHGLPIPQTDNAPHSSTPHINSTDAYEALAAAERFYAQQLRQHAVAIDYLKGRGLSGETVQRFGLGWAPDAWDGLDKAGVGGTKVLFDAGLLVENDNGRRYDRFRGRVMFPIRNSRGRVIGFGGRVLDDGQPKYLNSPETELFHKGSELYGLYEARQVASGRLAAVLVVEGYMDVIALAQHGINYAVATLGTATTADHIQKLYRATEAIVFCFDGDRAGRQAAERAVEQVLPHLRGERQARLLFLPDGEDPDSLVCAEGQQGFEQRITQAKPVLDHLLEQWLIKADPASLDGRARLAEIAKPQLALMPDGPTRDLLAQALAKHTGAKAAQLAEPMSAPTQSFVAPQKLSLVRQIFIRLLQDPALAQRVAALEQLAAIAQPGVDALVQVLRLLQDNPQWQLANLLEHYRDQPFAQHLSKLSQMEALVENEEPAAEFDDAIGRLLARGRELEIERLLAQDRAGGLDEQQKTRLRQLLLA